MDLRVNDPDDSSWLHPEAAKEYDAIASQVQPDDSALINALADFWRKYLEIRVNPSLLEQLRELPRGADGDADTTYWELPCCPDDEGVIAVIGKKGKKILALSIVRFTSNVHEMLWHDDQAEAAGRARNRRI